MNILQDSFDYGGCRFIAASGTMATSASNGRRGTASLHGTGYGYIPITPGSGLGVAVGVAVNPGITFTAGRERILAIGNENGEQAILRHEESGALTLYRGSTLIVSSSPGALPFGEYSFIEAYIPLSNTATVEVRVAGVGTILVLSADTLDTGSNTPSRVYLYPYGTRHYDDLFVNDTLGAVNNGFLGDMRIDAHFPDEDVAVAWTPSQGVLNYDNVNEQSPNDEVDYNHTTVSGVADYYGVQTLIPRLAGIAAVSLLQRTLASGTATVRGSIRMNGVNYPHAPIHVLASGYSYYETIIEASPETEDPFTDAEFNAASWGPERVI